MKKIILLVIAFILTLTLSACGDNKDYICKVEYNNSYIETYEVDRVVMQGTKTTLTLHNGEQIKINNNSVICYLDEGEE